MNASDLARTASSLAHPEWARPAEITRLFGIKRSTLWSLMADESIKSVSLRRKNQLKGTRLVNIQSVRDFIERLA